MIKNTIGFFRDNYKTVVLWFVTSLDLPNRTSLNKLQLARRNYWLALQNNPKHHLAWFIAHK